MKTHQRFNGMRLSADDRKELGRLKKTAKLTARTWRRIRVLELLDEGLSVRAAAKAVGTYPREASRIGRRYVGRGLKAALTDDPRGIPARKLDSTQEAAVVAMVCGPPPEGLARWSVRVASQEAVRRGIVDSVGRETIRVVLTTHDLKPWREKNVVRAGD